MKKRWIIILVFSFLFIQSKFILIFSQVILVKGYVTDSEKDIHIPNINIF
jgi:hypothetical protein